MTRAFLPLLHASDDGHLVNLSSIFGMVAARANGVFGRKVRDTRIHHRWTQLEGSTVGVTVVHPGGVATSIAKTAAPPAGATREQLGRNLKSFSKTLRMPPEEAAR